MSSRQQASATSRLAQPKANGGFGPLREVAACIGTSTQLGSGSGSRSGLRAARDRRKGRSTPLGLSMNGRGCTAPPGPSATALERIAARSDERRAPGVDTDAGRRHGAQHTVGHAGSHRRAAVVGRPLGWGSALRPPLRPWVDRASRKSPAEPRRRGSLRVNQSSDRTRPGASRRFRCGTGAPNRAARVR